MMCEACRSRPAKETIRDQHVCRQCARRLIPKRRDRHAKRQTEIEEAKKKAEAEEKKAEEQAERDDSDAEVQ